MTTKKPTKKKKKKKANPDRNGFFTWTVEISVNKTWVENGFNLTDDRAQDMMQREISCAYSSEVKTRVIKTPNLDKVAQAQGYKNAKDPRFKERG